jgi:hypothetical protein
MNFTTVSNQMGGNNSKLKIFRELHNYTVKYIAEDILNIKVAAYQKLEQQPAKLTGEQADKLALLYKISITELLAMDNPVVTFSNNTIDKAYIHNHYEFEKEILEKMISSRDLVSAIRFPHQWFSENTSR